MAIVKARVIVRGFRKSIEDIALVDTNSTYTLVSGVLAQEVGLRILDKKVRLIVADGHEIIGNLAIVNELVAED